MNFETPETIPGGESFLSGISVTETCPAQGLPSITVHFEEGSRDQVDIDRLVPEPNQVFTLWRGPNGASFHPLNLFSFPTEDQPVDSIEPIIIQPDTGSWILEVSNISSDPVLLNGWGIDLRCPAEINGLEYSVSDGLSALEPHIGQYPNALTYPGYKDNETCSPGDASYREFTIPNASSLQITIWHQTEISYDFLKVIDLSTGDELLSVSGPEDAESNDIATVEIPSNTFAICVESDTIGQSASGLASRGPEPHPLSPPSAFSPSPHRAVTSRRPFFTPHPMTHRQPFSPSFSVAAPSPRQHQPRSPQKKTPCLVTEAGGLYIKWFARLRTRKHRLQVLTTHHGNIADGNFLRTGRLTLTDIRAGAKTLDIHLIDHSTGPTMSLRIALGQHTQVPDFRGRKERRRRIRAGRHTGTAANAGRRIKGQI